MRKVSADSAQLTDEFGIRVGRWTQYRGAEEFPFGAMWCVVPAGSHTEPDSHPEVELAVIVDGGAVFETDGATIDAAQGSAVLLSSHEQHVVHNTSHDAPLVMLSIYWLPAEAGEPGDGP